MYSTYHHPAKHCRPLLLRSPPKWNSSGKLEVNVNGVTLLGLSLANAPNTKLNTKCA
jgi:hypothetical protein